MRAVGDCFFAAIRDAFKSVSIDIDVKKQREMLSSITDEKQYTTYKELHDNISKSIKENKITDDSLIEKRKILATEYKMISTKGKIEKDRSKKLELSNKSKQIKKEYDNYKTRIIELRKERKDMEELEKEFMFMKNINNTKELKDMILSSEYWADSSAISKMEEILNVKVIILNNEFYHSGEYDKILSCGDMIPEKIERTGVFNPKYYILLDHSNKHYKLITYKKK